MFCFRCENIDGKNFYIFIRIDHFLFITVTDMDLNPTCSFQFVDTFNSTCFSKFCFVQFRRFAFYLFYDRPKTNFYCIDSMVERFPTFFPCVCLILVLLFGDSFCYYFSSSIIFSSNWPFDYSEWNMGQSRNGYDKRACFSHS